MTQVFPDITCTKCSTVVPWGPHCPHCRAYLEFSGIPPWQPEPPAAEADQGVPSESVAKSEVEGEGTEEQPDASALGDVSADLQADAIPAPEVAQPPASEEATGSNEVPQELTEIQPLPEALQVAEAITGVRAAKHARPSDAREARQPGSWTLLGRGWRRQPGRNFVATIVAVILALLVVALLATVSASHAAWIVAPLLGAWAVIAVAVYGTIPDQRAHVDAPPPEPVEPEQAEIRDDGEAEPELVLLEPELDDGIRSREPQLISPTAEKSKPLLSGTHVVRDVACGECGHLNLRDVSFCASCGEVLPGAQVAPDIVAYTLVEDDDKDDAKTTPDGRRRQRRRRISGSWRNTLVALALVGVVIGAFLFAFFGPGALRVRFGMVQAFQVINQWVDPYYGDTATVSNVTTSSSLLGTFASALKDSDARTFWASESLPDYATGTTATFTFDEPSLINRMVIYPGVQNLQFDRRALATPRRITLTFDNGTSVGATLFALASNNDARQLVKFPDVTTKTVVLTINSVYPPIERSDDNWGEVALSGVSFLEVPQPPAVFGFQMGTRVPGLPGITQK